MNAPTNRELSVLIVDDEAIARRRLRRMLERILSGVVSAMSAPSTLIRGRM